MEMRLEKWLRLAILYGFVPNNENQVAIGTRSRTIFTAAYFE